MKHTSTLDTYPPSSLRIVLKLVHFDKSARKSMTSAIMLTDKPAIEADMEIVSDYDIERKLLMSVKLSSNCQMCPRKSSIDNRRKGLGEVTDAYDFHGSNETLVYGVHIKSDAV
ncbi:hypothetical protein CEXT_23291 [Caerostris extrusa]|uniref:Uncharacterized protein n=1 Tax=Caerostris extrusa TaxID=172846 RepID=A0AAV4XIM9_CAEEX|nr:hypothetical protein CEXT_23291 [Caerostris extrusa]